MIENTARAAEIWTAIIIMPFGRPYFSLTVPTEMLVMTTPREPEAAKTVSRNQYGLEGGKGPGETEAGDENSRRQNERVHRKEYS